MNSIRVNIVTGENWSDLLDAIGIKDISDESEVEDAELRSRAACVFKAAIEDSTDLKNLTKAALGESLSGGSSPPSLFLIYFLLSASGNDSIFKQLMQGERSDDQPISSRAASAVLMLICAVTNTVWGSGTDALPEFVLEAYNEVSESDPLDQLSFLKAQQILMSVSSPPPLPTPLPSPSLLSLSLSITHWQLTRFHTPAA